MIATFLNISAQNEHKQIYLLFLLIIIFLKTFFHDTSNHDKLHKSLKL